MLWKRKSDPNPLGVPLGDLILALRSMRIKASLVGTTLVARHEHSTTRIEVAPTKVHASAEKGKIRAVVRMTTELPQHFVKLYKEPEAMVAMNSFCGIGRLVVGPRPCLRWVPADYLRG